MSTPRSRPAVLASLAAVLMLASGCTERTTHSKWDRQLLERFRNDPVTSYRPPGAELQTTRALLGGTLHVLLGGPYGKASELIQTLSIAGDVGDAVASYTGPASAAGWRLVKVSCSRQALSVEAFFTTQPAGLSTTIPINEPNGGSLRVGEVLTVTGSQEARSLMVQFSWGPPPEAPSPTSLDLPRRDVHCLKGFDPGDPRRQPRSVVPARSAEQLCALAAVEPLAGKLVEAPFRADAFGGFPPKCELYTTDARIVLYDAAQRTQMSFADRQYSRQYADDGFFLIARAEGGPDTDKLAGAWIDTPGGPIEADISGGEEVARVLGRLIQKIATAQPTALPRIAPSSTAVSVPTTGAPRQTTGRCHQSLVADPNCDVGPTVTAHRP